MAASGIQTRTRALFALVEGCRTRASGVTAGFIANQILAGASNAHLHLKALIATGHAVRHWDEELRGWMYQPTDQAITVVTACRSRKASSRPAVGSPRKQTGTGNQRHTKEP